MSTRPLRDAGLGIPIGVVAALGFAFIIGLIPDAAFSETGWRIVLYAAQVPAGPVLVLAIAALAGVLSCDRHRFVLAVVAGALVFDGLAVGFLPGVYGQPAESAVWVGSTLLWAFAWIVIAELVIDARRRRTAALREARA
jgi:hypothetical protein